MPSVENETTPDTLDELNEDKFGEAANAGYGDEPEPRDTPKLDALMAEVKGLEEARQAADDDAKLREENDGLVVRAAREDVGGESFHYGFTE